MRTLLFLAFLTVGCGGWRLDYRNKYAALDDAGQEKIQDFRLELAGLTVGDIVSIQHDDGQLVDYLVKHEWDHEFVLVAQYGADGYADHAVVHVGYIYSNEALYWYERITMIHRQGEPGWEEAARHYYLCG